MGRIRDNLGWLLLGLVLTPFGVVCLYIAETQIIDLYEEAYKEGYHAASSKLPVEACPYSAFTVEESHQRKGWIRGWSSCRVLMEKK
jgi:ribosome modulation factor